MTNRTQWFALLLSLGIATSLVAQTKSGPDSKPKSEPVCGSDCRF